MARPLAALYAWFFFDTSCWAAIQAYMSALAMPLGLWPEGAALYGLGILFGMPVCGHLHDQFGRKVGMALQSFGGSSLPAALLLLATLANVTDDQAWFQRYLFGAQFLMGLLSCNFSVAAAYVADVVEPVDREKYLGYNCAVSLAAFTTGGLIASAAAAAPALFALAVLTALNGVAALLLAPETNPTSEQPQLKRELSPPVLRRELSQTMGSIFQIRVAQVVFAVTGLQFFGFASTETIIGAGAWVDLFGGATGVMMGLLFVDPLKALIGSTGMLAAGNLMRVAAALSLALMPSISWLVNGTAAGMYGSVVLIDAARDAVLSRAVDPKMRGKILGMSKSFGACGRTLGSLVGLLNIGDTTPLYLTALASGTAALLVVLFLCERPAVAREGADQSHRQWLLSVDP
jgi:MFS family permease